MIFSENRCAPVGSWPGGMLFRIMRQSSPVLLPAVNGLSGWRIGEQAALGKADAVDQDHPEDEADQARCHAEPPI